MFISEKPEGVDQVPQPVVVTHSKPIMFTAKESLKMVDAKKIKGRGKAGALEDTDTSLGVE